MFVPTSGPADFRTHLRRIYHICSSLFIFLLVFDHCMNWRTLIIQKRFNVIVIRDDIIVTLSICEALSRVSKMLSRIVKFRRGLGSGEKYEDLQDSGMEVPDYGTRNNQDGGESKQAMPASPTYGEGRSSFWSYWLYLKFLKF